MVLGSPVVVKYPLSEPFALTQWNGQRGHIAAFMTLRDGGAGAIVRLEGRDLEIVFGLAELALAA